MRVSRFVERQEAENREPGGAGPRRGWLRRAMCVAPCLLFLDSALLAACTRSTEPPADTRVSEAAVSTAFGPVPAARTAAPDADRFVWGEREPFAIVELFTSEGCSSCPPADAVLAEIARWGEARGQRIITLGFHVDYWDSLGWKDRFSDRTYSDRQRWYAANRTRNRVYTPQLVVNGRDELVGSRRDRAFDLVKLALREPASVRVGLALGGSAGAERVFRYRVQGAEATAYLNLALLQQSSSTSVERGENAGRRLDHVNVVRRFVMKRVDGGSGEWNVTLPDAPATAPFQVVAYVQDGTTLEVTGAVALSTD